MKNWTQLNWWGVAGSREISKDELIHSKIFNLHKNNYQPPWRWVYRAFNMTPFDQVRVVILGQDPYPTKGHATGLAFAVPGGTDPLPPSLKNIFFELEDDLSVKPPDNDLGGWASQGILLLNVNLTVEIGKPNSHMGIGWKDLTVPALTALVEHRREIVFVLWGQFALNAFNEAVMHAEIGAWRRNGHHRIITPHPSPMSADKGFFGSKCFSQVNTLLSKPIDWSM